MAETWKAVQLEKPKGSFTHANFDAIFSRAPMQLLSQVATRGDFIAISLRFGCDFSCNIPKIVATLHQVSNIFETSPILRRQITQKSH